MGYRIFSYGCTDVGRKRETNQDSYRIAPDIDLYVVADGMGGYKGGEVASRMAVRAVEEHVRSHYAALALPVDPSRPRDGALPKVFSEAVRRACREIYERGEREPELRDMGTTTTALLVQGGWGFVAHVGDSRCYLLRDHRIHLVSEDHSLVFEQVKAGYITPEEAERSPFKNIITRAVGIAPDVEVDMTAVELRSGDGFLMCSDGLTGLVRDEELNRIVNENFLHRVPELLVDLANERGGPDNITVVLTYLVDERELPDPVPYRARGPEERHL